MSSRPKDQVLAQIRHQETDLIPYTLCFEGDVEERLDAYYGGTQWRELVDNAIRRVTSPPLGVVGDGSDDLYTDPYGSVWRVDCRPFHLVEPALKSPSLGRLSFPDLDDLFTDAWLAKTLDAIQEAKNYFVVVSFGFGLFERTWALRGFDEALADAAAQPEFFEDLVEAVAEHQLAIVDRLLELPVDGVMFSDDWGYQRGVLLGPERWRRMLKPRLACMYDHVHAAGKYTLSHCCGSVVDIVDDLIEIGLDTLESVQPEARGMDPYQLKRDFGDRIAFWGGLGSQSTIPFGSPDEIQGEVTKLCREMGRDGGYILSPAKPLQPETPTENAAAVIASFLQQR